jgi:hypothetical protein
MFAIVIIFYSLHTFTVKCLPSWMYFINLIVLYFSNISIYISFAFAHPLMFLVDSFFIIFQFPEHVCGHHIHCFKEQFCNTTSVTKLFITADHRLLAELHPCPHVPQEHLSNILLISPVLLHLLCQFLSLPWAFCHILIVCVCVCVVAFPSFWSSFSIQCISVIITILLQHTGACMLIIIFISNKHFWSNSLSHGLVIILQCGWKVAYIDQFFLYM